MPAPGTTAPGITFRLPRRPAFILSPCRPVAGRVAAEHCASSPFIGQALMELAGQGLLTRVPSIGYLTPGTDHRPPPAVIAVVLE
jgi:hypothetical protein